MREKPTVDQMLARKLFLDCHKDRIALLYGFPDNDLTFNSEMREILYRGGIPASKMCFEFLKSAEGAKRIIAARSRYKKRLEDRLAEPSDDFLEDWFVHLDYESLIMDKLIDLDAIPVELLVTGEVMPFFERNYLFRIMHQGYQLSRTTDKYSPRSQWFSQWDDKWFAKFALTKHRLIDILNNYSDRWITEFIKANQPTFKSIEDIYETMREMYLKRQISSRKNEQKRKAFIKCNPELRYYVTFVKHAMDYNEELRTYRSCSFWNFLQNCRKKGMHPFETFLESIKIRKQRMSENNDEYTRG